MNFSEVQKKRQGRTLTLFLYPRGESNPYLKFRKLLFYPLNYKGNVFTKVIYLVHIITILMHYFCFNLCKFATIELVN